MPVTTDAADPKLGKKTDDGQMESYLVLSEEERTKGFIRPVRDVYVHKTCGQITRIAKEIAESFARDPKMYSHTFCTTCKNHLAVSEFVWEKTKILVGD